MARTGSEEAVNHLVGHVGIRESAFDASPVAQIVVEFGGAHILANERACALFNIVPVDLSRPLQDLQVSHRPAELRASIDHAYTERREVVLKDVEWSLGSGRVVHYEILVTPLIDAGGSLLGASVTFAHTTATRRIAAEPERSTRELESAYEELQSTNEKLETTNEELQSTVEELETTSEELETTSEELQSTNEELETVNEELRLRSVELRRVSTFLESILGSLRGGVVVVDPDLLILVWNQNAEDLWGVRAEEVRARNVLNLDIGLPVVLLKPALLACLSGEASYPAMVLDATHRRGRAIRCRVACTPMTSGDRSVIGVIVMMDDEAELVDGEASRPAASGNVDGERKEQPGVAPAPPQ